MANLDTRSKRASSVQILVPWVLAPLLPDGTIAQGDRQHIAWTYSGILAVAGGYVAIFKRWNGTAWVKAKLNRWTGVAWVAGVLKVYKNSAWGTVDTTGV